MLCSCLSKQSNWIFTASLAGKYQPSSTVLAEDSKNNASSLINRSGKPIVPLLDQIPHGLGGHGRWSSETHGFSVYPYSEPRSNTSIVLTWFGLFEHFQQIPLLEHGPLSHQRHHLGRKCQGMIYDGDSLQAMLAH